MAFGKEPIKKPSVEEVKKHKAYIKKKIKEEQKKLNKTDKS